MGVIFTFPFKPLRAIQIYYEEEPPGVATERRSRLLIGFHECDVIIIRLCREKNVIILIYIEIFFKKFYLQLFFKFDQAPKLQFNLEIIQDFFKNCQDSAVWLTEVY